MKKLLLLALLGSSACFGQITLTDQDFPAVNEEFVFSTLTDLNIDFATTGQNQLWDFSTLVPTGQRGYTTKPLNQAGQLSNLFFGSFALPQYKATYFNSTVDFPISQFTAALPISIDDISMFTRKTTSEVTSIGYELIISGQKIGVKSDTIETRYVLPVSFGNSYNSRGYTSLNLSPIYDAKWRQHRSRVSTVDGFGTVTTPHGTYNALRIHHIINEIDSFYVSINGTGTWIGIPVPVAHEYEWRSNDDNEAVMRVRTSEVAGNETPTAVEYRDDYNGLGVEENNVLLTCSPNPVINSIHLESSTLLKEWVIIDASGKIVSRTHALGLNQDMDVSTLSNGSYTILGMNDSGVSAIKFIKQ